MQERAASPDQGTRGPFLLNNVERVHETMPQEPDDSQWYYDDELWLVLLRALDDSQIEHIVRLLHKLITEIQKPDGAFHVQCCLENGRRVAFPYTKFANDCKVLFIESLDGGFEPETDSLTILELTILDHAKRKRAANERDPIPED
jgi:hypothetical protein